MKINIFQKEINRIIEFYKTKRTPEKLGKLWTIFNVSSLFMAQNGKENYYSCLKNIDLIILRIKNSRCGLWTWINFKPDFDTLKLKVPYFWVFFSCDFRRTHYFPALSPVAVYLPPLP